MDFRHKADSEDLEDDLIVCACALAVEIIVAEEENTAGARQGRKRAASTTLAEIQHDHSARRLRFDNWQSLRCADGELFRRRLRLSPAQFHFVVQLVRQHMPTSSRRPHIVDADKALAVFLMFLAHGRTVDDLASEFAIGRSTAHRTVRKVAVVLARHLLPRVMLWPTPAERQRLTTLHRQLYALPAAVGFIDCSHIPCVEDESSLNHKCWHSTVLQAVVDKGLRFLHMTCGFGGRTHDSRVLRCSTLWDRIKARGDFLSEGECVVGDRGYPSFQWLVVPFRAHRVLTAAERDFNYALQQARQCVEHAFAKLKGQWRLLSGVHSVYASHQMAVFAAAAVALHNVTVTVHPDTAEELEHSMFEPDPGLAVSEDMPHDTAAAAALFRAPSDSEAAPAEWMQHAVPAANDLRARWVTAVIQHNADRATQGVPVP